ncbi:MAG: GNAT family N-acetyltransferase [Candidatus Fermentibacter sp.]|nr:GNAT family N-acetyltransferase [Candidatus Fermentibacter sp.]
MVRGVTRLCSMLEWDSSFFGLRIARYARVGMTPAQAASVKSWCSSNAVDCLYFLADPGDGPSLGSAHGLGMRAAGIRAEMRVETARIPASETAGPVRRAIPSDIPLLEDLATENHTSSRFFVDPGFGRKRASAMFSYWMRKCFSDPRCTLLVAGDAGRPGGYCAVRDRAGEGVIELLGVAPGNRSAGLGKALVSAASRILGDAGVAHVSVVTQAGTAGAMGFYERLGFVTDRMGIWFHYWPSLGPKT